MIRNDQCRCGSGKKYKQCCASKTPANINQLVEADILELKQNILQFALTNYEEKINSCMDQFFGEVVIEDKEQFDRVGFMLMLWIVFSLPIAENQQTILETFIKKNRKKIKRPALREAIHQWQEAVPSIYKVVKEIDAVQLLVEDIFTKEEKQIQLLALKEGTVGDCEKLAGCYILGTVIQYRNSSIFFATFCKIENRDTIAELLTFYDFHADEYSPKQFVDQLFPEIIEIIFSEPLNLDELSWDTDKQKQVIELIKEKLDFPADIQKPIESLVITLWKIYCTKTGGDIRSVSKYAAALHYIVGYFFIFFGEAEPTKKQLMKQYDVKMRTLTETIAMLEDVLDEDIECLLDDLTADFDEEFDDDDELDYDDLLIDEDDLFRESFSENDDEVKLHDLFEDLEDEFWDNPQKSSKPIVDELALRRLAKAKNKR